MQKRFIGVQWPVISSDGYLSLFLVLRIGL
jgi:hypothetical protein